MAISYVIGVDEVGRGPLAGPVMVCACILPIRLYRGGYRGLKAVLDKEEGKGLASSPKGQKSSRYTQKLFDQIKDSKVISEKTREIVGEQLVLLAPKYFYFSIKSKSAKDIDKYGIAICIKNLVNEVIEDVCSLVGAGKSGGFAADLVDPKKVLILLDGSLYAPEKFKNQKTIIKGDAKEKIIALASILAKVHRDKYMKKIANKNEFIKYDFVKHKGYGTLKHREVIKEQGLSNEHRRSFCEKILQQYK